MGQKLEKLLEKDEEPFENSNEQTREPEEMEATEQDASRDQDNSSFGGISVSDQVTGDRQEFTLIPAHRNLQIGQPIRPLGQQEHTVNTRVGKVGGDRENWSIDQTVRESKTTLHTKKTRQNLNNSKNSERKAVASIGTTAMDQETRKKLELGQRKLGAEAQTRSLTASCNLPNEDDFVVLEEDETLISAAEEKNIAFGKRIQADALQTLAKRQIEEGASAGYSDENLPQASRYAPQEKGVGTTKKSDANSLSADGIESHDKSLPAACFEREMGQHLAEVTGSRCQLKGVSNPGAVRSETTGKAERDQNMNERRKGQVFTASGSVKRLRRSTDDMADEDFHVISEEDSRGKRERKPNSGFFAEETQGREDQHHQSKFAGAVSKRTKAGMSTKRAESQVFVKAANTHTLDHPGSDILQDNLSLALEESGLPPCPLLIGNEGTDEKRQIASLKRESELVCFSAVITPPPVTYQLPKKNASVETQLSKVNSQLGSDSPPVPCDSNDTSMSKEKPKVKGPPPPVPKKPKNPFIKLKAAQLMSTDVQRRGKDHLQSEERVKRRHTFHFNKDVPWITPKNQDMCVLWEERRMYTAPTNRRPLSVDLGPWEHGALERMDHQYGDMINFDYCTRVEKLSPEEELQNLDMLQRRVFLERQARFKSSPPAVAKKPPNPFASTETLPEVTPDSELQRSKPDHSRKRDISPELQLEVSGNVSKYMADNRKDITDYNSFREDVSEIGSYKPVAEIVKATNEMQRRQSRVKPERAKPQIIVSEQSPSVKVSQMKNTFDVPKKSKERPPEVESSPKKGKKSGGVPDIDSSDTSLAYSVERPQSTSHIIEKASTLDWQHTCPDNGTILDKLLSIGNHLISQKKKKKKSVIKIQ